VCVQKANNNDYIVNQGWVEFDFLS